MDTITTALQGKSGRLALWFATACVALAGGFIAVRLPTGYFLGVVALLLVVAVSLWRSQESIIPFLLLVAAIQGGVLLQLPLGDAPIQGLLPLLGAWALAAAVLGKEPNHLRLPANGPGRLLPNALLGLGAVVVLTAVAQNWRPNGQLLSLTALLTAVQLGVLVWLTAFVLSSPRKALLVAYVSIAAGTVVSLAALADLAGLLSIGTDLAYGGYTRVSGLVADPNFFSAQLLVSLACAVQVGLRAKSTAGRLLVWVAAGVVIAGIVTTYSAGALVGVAAVLGVTVLLQLRMSASRALAAIAVIAVLTGLVAGLAPSTYREAMTTKYSTLRHGTFETVGTKRGAAWEAASREIAANPVLGVGFGSENLVVAIADFYTYERVERRAAHNMYLGMAVGTGVVGLGLFLVILASCFRVLWSAYGKAAHDKRSETARATACLLAVLVVVATQGLQLDLQFDKYLWLLVGACVAVRHWAARSEPPVATASVTTTEDPHAHSDR